MPAPIDLTNQRFGKLVAKTVTTIGKRRKWACTCDCGGAALVETNDLRSGHTQSCGCLHTEFVKSLRYKHGMSETRVFKIWKGIIARCTSPSNKAWPNYGGRGIHVCAAWMEFKNFYADMGDPGESLTIERIDNNGHYEPGNCRWASRQEQAQNTRHTKLITFNGKSQSLSLWAKELGIHPMTLNTRLDNGWSIEKALTKPVMTPEEVGSSSASKMKRDNKGRFA